MEQENKFKCPQCGKEKKPWFKLCWECTEKENQKPKCEVCNKPIEEGKTLCLEHWKEKQQQLKDIKKVDYVKNKKEIEYKDKFEGKYYFNSQKVKSKSELLICYFLSANQIQFQYETPMTPNGKEIRPDFILFDKKGNMIILEHFGIDEQEYNKKKENKIKEYSELCKNHEEFYFISTNEEDITNLKERLGKKLNETPLKKVIWI